MGNIGFISISHNDYQCNLVDEMTASARALIEQCGHTVVPVEEHITSLVSARKAGRDLAAADIDGIVVFLASWMECPVLMAAVRHFEHIPICLWGYPMVNIDGQLESAGSYVSFAMIKGTFDRVGYRYLPLLGLPSEPSVKLKISAFSAAVSCAARLKDSVIGLVGYTSMSIYTGTFDHVFMRVKIGPEIEQMDSYTLINLAESFTAEEKAAEAARFGELASVDSDVSAEIMRKTAGISLALRQICRERNLEAINVKCQYEFSKEYKAVPCVPLSFLADDGIVASCEGDILNTVSMLILNHLSGQVPTYGDAMHHEGGVIKLSSCGFAPFSLAISDKACIRRFMPHPGFSGIQNSSLYRPGRVTVLRLIEDRCDYHFLYFTGEVLPTPLRQSYMPAMDIRLDGSAEELTAAYAGQHFAVVYGDWSQEIKTLADILGIAAIRI